MWVVTWRNIQLRVIGKHLKSWFLRKQNSNLLGSLMSMNAQQTIEIFGRWTYGIFRAFSEGTSHIKCTLESLTFPWERLCVAWGFHLGMRDYLPEVCC